MFNSSMISTIQTINFWKVNIDLFFVFFKKLKNEFPSKLYLKY